MVVFSCFSDFQEHSCECSAVLPITHSPATSFSTITLRMQRSASNYLQLRGWVYKGLGSIIDSVSIELMEWASQSLKAVLVVVLGKPNVMDTRDITGCHELTPTCFPATDALATCVGSWGTILCWFYLLAQFLLVGLPRTTPPRFWEFSFTLYLSNSQPPSPGSFQCVT